VRCGLKGFITPPVIDPCVPHFISVRITVAIHF
jgi:hypothetical protein